MTEKMEVKLIGAEVIRLSLQPGDVLVVSWPTARSKEDLLNVRDSFQEIFGVPTVVLHSGMELKALLNVSPECQGLAAAARAKAAEIEAERMMKMMESIANKKEPAHA